MKNKNNVNWTIYTHTYTLIYSNRNVHNLLALWQVDLLSSCLLSGMVADGVGIVFTMVHCCKHDADAISNSPHYVSKHSSSVKREVHPVKETINCVHVCMYTYTLIYIQIGMYTIYWLLDRMSSSPHGCWMFTEFCGLGSAVAAAAAAVPCLQLCTVVNMMPTLLPTCGHSNQ